MAYGVGPNLVRDGLVLYLDAANPKSYPGSGTAWNDLTSGGNNGTLVNGVGYTSDNGGAMVFDGVDDYFTTTTTPTELLGNPSFTVSGWFFRLGNLPNNTGTWGFGGNSVNQGINSWWSNNNNQITIDTWGQATFTTGAEYPLQQWVYVTWQKISGPMTRDNCILWRNLDSYTGNQLTILRAENVAPNINNLGVTVGRISTTYNVPVNIRVSGFSVYNRILTPDEINTKLSTPLVVDLVYRIGYIVYGIWSGS
jgi:hypothetical protein